MKVSVWGGQRRVGSALPPGRVLEDDPFGTTLAPAVDRVAVGKATNWEAGGGKKAAGGQQHAGACLAISGAEHHIEVRHELELVFVSGQSRRGIITRAVAQSTPRSSLC